MSLGKQNSIEILEVHAEGEVGQILTKGAPSIPGDTLLQQMQFINETLVSSSFNLTTSSVSEIKDASP